MKSLKSYLHCFPETARFFGIRTDLLYRYYFSVSLDILILDVLTFTMLSLITCLILLSVMLSPDIRYDIADSDNYHDNRNDDLTS